MNQSDIRGLSLGDRADIDGTSRDTKMNKLTS